MQHSHSGSLAGLHGFLKFKFPGPAEHGSWADSEADSESDPAGRPGGYRGGIRFGLGDGCGGSLFRVNLRVSVAGY
jgi:hypothetical protein